jgi:hypothetical protein
MASRAARRSLPPSVWVATHKEDVPRTRCRSEFPLEISFSTWSTSQGRYVTGMIRDLSARKRLEETTRQQELPAAHPPCPSPASAQPDGRHSHSGRSVRPEGRPDRLPTLREAEDRLIAACDDRSGRCRRSSQGLARLPHRRVVVRRQGESSFTAGRAWHGVCPLRVGTRNRRSKSASPSTLPAGRRRASGDATSTGASSTGRSHSHGLAGVHARDRHA